MYKGNYKGTAFIMFMYVCNKRKILITNALPCCHNVDFLRKKVPFIIVYIKLIKMNREQSTWKEFRFWRKDVAVLTWGNRYFLGK